MIWIDWPIQFNYGSNMFHVRPAELHGVSSNPSDELYQQKQHHASIAAVNSNFCCFIWCSDMVGCYYIDIMLLKGSINSSESRIWNMILLTLIIKKTHSCRNLLLHTFWQILSVRCLQIRGGYWLLIAFEIESHFYYS